MVAPYIQRFYPAWLKRTNGTKMCGMPETTPADISADWTRVLALATAMTGDEARAQHLLRVLVESYIREGQPVGSRTLSRDSGLNLSAATVRNVMADLEEYGFVTSPHTSAAILTLLVPIRKS